MCSISGSTRKQGEYFSSSWWIKIQNTKYVQNTVEYPDTKLYVRIYSAKVHVPLTYEHVKIILYGNRVLNEYGEHNFVTRL